MQLRTLIIMSALRCEKTLKLMTSQTAMKETRDGRNLSLKIEFKPSPSLHIGRPNDWFLSNASY